MKPNEYPMVSCINVNAARYSLRATLINTVSGQDVANAALCQCPDIHVPKYKPGVVDSETLVRDPSKGKGERDCVRVGSLTPMLIHLLLPG